MERSERLGMGVSAAGHILLFGALSLGLLRTSVTIPPAPPAIDVSLADEVALRSSTPNPSTAMPEPATAPELGQVEPDAAPPEPAPPVVTPAPVPKPVEAPKPKPKPEPVPVQKQPEKPAPAKAKPAPQPAPKAADAKPKPQAKPQRAPRLGADFLKGLDTDAPPSRNPAPVAGSNAPMSAIAARALNAEITRQIKPFWRPPSGADAEKLVTLLSVRLDRNGAVIGQIEVVGQEGVTASNRAQADLHAERAVQAVLRASPFKDLPPEYYDQWKWLRPLRIYASLGQ
jgi:outer membrane biosynthesis protein TonB